MLNVLEYKIRQPTQVFYYVSDGSFFWQRPFFLRFRRLFSFLGPANGQEFRKVVVLSYARFMRT
jgi:hypothetical protein